jgi:hypothetical protein
VTDGGATVGSKQHVVCTQRYDVMPGAEVNALAAIYGRAIKRYEQTKAAGCDQHRGGDDTKEGLRDDFRAEINIHE